MVKLHAELIAKNVKIIREELPGVKIWFCSDNLHAEAPHVARWCGIDVSLSDAIIDYHMHMPYYAGARFFDDTAYNIENLKKPYFPLIDPAERIQSFFLFLRLHRASLQKHSVLQPERQKPRICERR